MQNACNLAVLVEQFIASFQTAPIELILDFDAILKLLVKRLRQV